MKKLLIIFFVLISVSSFAQKRTSYDVDREIKAALTNNVVLITDKIANLFKEYTALKIREYRNLPEKQLIVINSIQGYCFTCQCANGHVILQGDGNCGYKNYGCGPCPIDGLQMQAYVQACAGSPCGNIIGAK
jgi:hypothetical protein